MTTLITSLFDASRSMLDALSALLPDLALKTALLLLVALAIDVALRRASAATRHVHWQLALGGALALALLTPVSPALLPALRVSVPLPGALAALASRPVADSAARSGPGRAVTAAAATSADIRRAGTDSPTSRPPRTPPAARQPLLPLHQPGDALAHEAALPEAAAATSAAPAAAPTLSGLRLAAHATPTGGSITSAAQPSTWSRFAASLSSTGWITWLTLLWIGGALLVLALLAVSLLRARGMAQAARPVTDPAWLSLLDRTSRELSLKRRVALLIADGPVVPMTWGHAHPVVLLPADAQDWSPPRRRQVLLHELAHVQRGDWLTQLFAQLACAMSWYQPLAWLAARRLRQEREHACDDRVLTAGNRPSDYAGHLLDIARSRQVGLTGSFATLAMARPSQLEGRLLAVLDERRDRRAMARRRTLLAGSGAALLVLALACVQPRAESPASPVAPSTEPAPVGSSQDLAPVTTTLVQRNRVEEGIRTLTDRSSGRSIVRTAPAEMPTPVAEPVALTLNLARGTAPPAAAAPRNVLVQVNGLLAAPTPAPTIWRVAAQEAPAPPPAPSDPFAPTQPTQPTQPAPPAPFAPFAPLAPTIALIEALTSTAFPFGSDCVIWSSGDSDEQRTWKWKSGDETFSVTIEGWLYPDDPALHVSRMDDEASFTLEHVHAGVTDRIEVTARDEDEREADGGAEDAPYIDLQLAGTLNGSAADRSALQAELDRLMPAVLGQTGLFASQRIDHLMQHGGVAAVLAELAALPSEPVRTAWYMALFTEQDLDTGDAAAALNQVAQDLPTDAHLAELLACIGPDVLADPDLAEPLFTAVDSLDSDAYAAQALAELLCGEHLDGPVLARALHTAASGLESDAYMADMLASVPGARLRDADVRPAFLAALATVGSDAYAAQIVAPLLDQRGVKGEALAALLAACASSVDSDAYLAEILQSLPPRALADERVGAAALVAFGSIESDAYLADVLGSLIESGDLPAAQVGALLDAAADGLDSDAYMAQLLMTLETESLDDTALRPHFDKALATIESPSYRDEVLVTHELKPEED